MPELYPKTDHRSTNLARTTDPTLVDRARMARELTTHIETAFHAMSWRKERILNPRQSYWDLLSYLFVARGELTTISACRRHLREIAENTADYQLKALIGAGVLETSPHPHDKRAKIVKLSASADAELSRFFSSFDATFQIIHSADNS